MHFLITPRRRLGVALTKEEIRAAAPIKGDVQIAESLHPVLGRVSAQAFLLSSVGHAPDIIPRLLDASVTSMGTHGLNISGIEQVGEAFYFQSWWCRFE